MSLRDDHQQSLDVTRGAAERASIDLVLSAVPLGMTLLFGLIIWSVPGTFILEVEAWRDSVITGLLLLAAIFGSVWISLFFRSRSLTQQYRDALSAARQDGLNPYEGLSGTSV